MNIKKISLCVIILVIIGGILGFSTWNQWNANQKTTIERMRPIRPIAELNHGRRIVDIAFTPTNQDIIASVSDYDIKLWNRNNTDSPTNTLSDDEEMLVSVEFLHNGKFLLCKGLHGKMILCDTYSWERITLPEEEEKVQWDAAISPSVENLATVHSQYLVLWNMQDINKINVTTKITEIHHTKYHNSMQCADFSPNGKRLAIGFENGDIRIWDIEQEQFIKTLSVSHDSHQHLDDIVFTPDGHWILALEESNLALWNIKQNQRHILLKDTRLGFLRDVKLSPDGRYIGIRTFGNSSEYIIWSLPEAQIYHQENEGFITDFAFSPDGKILAISNPGEVTLLSIEDLSPISILKGGDLLGGAHEIAFSQDGSMLAGGGNGGVVRLWDVSKYNEK